MERRKTAASGSKSSAGRANSRHSPAQDLQNSALLKLGQELKQSEGVQDQALYLFASFDLVNSTQFKPLFREQWPVIFRTFYELLDKQVKEQIPAMQLWKYVGDEILFHQRVKVKEDLSAAPAKVFDLLRSVMDSLNQSQNLPSHLLAVKGTLWLAPVTYLPPQLREETPLAEDQAANIRLYVTLEDRQTQVDDFLGPDIDLGFRIARYTDKFKLALSAELAYMLHLIDAKEIHACLKIVAFQSLKGIWSGRHYPIIWYFQDWDKFSASFDYDAPLNSEFIAQVQEVQRHKPIRELPEILRQIGKHKEIEGWLKFLSPSSSAITTNQPFMPPLARMAEVHCAAIAFRDDGKILAAKRPVTKKRLPGLWEFGCSQLKLDQHFETCLQEAYRNDFDLELDTTSLTPIAHYHLEDRREGRVIPGIIFVVKIVSEKGIEDRSNLKKHDQIRWVSPADLASFNDAEWVPDARQNLQKAFEYWQRLGHSVSKKVPSRKKP